MQVGCFHAWDSLGGWEDGRGRTLHLLSELLHSDMEEPCLLEGGEQQEPPAVRPDMLLSLTQQQDELQGTRMLQAPQALLGKMVFTPWDRSCRCRVHVAQRLPEPEQSRRGKIYRGKKPVCLTKRL